MLQQKYRPKLKYVILAFFCLLRPNSISPIPEWDGQTRCQVSSVYVVFFHCAGSCVVTPSDNLPRFFFFTWITGFFFFFLFFYTQHTTGSPLAHFYAEDLLAQEEHCHTSLRMTDSYFVEDQIRLCLELRLSLHYVRNQQFVIFIKVEKYVWWLGISLI